MGDFGFWAVAGGTTVAVLAVMLRALTKAPDTAEAHPDIAVYRAQLAEVDRDLSRGVISPEDAARLKVEVSRRLLDADKAARGVVSGRELPVLPMAALVALVLAGGVGLYLWLGAPGYPDLPINDRLAASEEVYRTRPDQATAEAQAPAPDAASQPKPDAEFSALMDKLRAAIAQHPDDVQGLTLLAQNEAALGNYKAAATAQLHLLQVKGEGAPTKDHLAAAEYLIAAAGAAIDLFAGPELEILAHADPHLAQPGAIAGHRDRRAAQARIGLDERLFDLVRRHRFFGLKIDEFVRNLHRRARFADGLKIRPRRQTRTGAVLVPFVEDQPRRRHQIEHRGHDLARQPRCWHLAIIRKTALILRPQPVHPEGERPPPVALGLLVAARRAALGGLRAIRRRPRQRQHVEIESTRRVLPAVLRIGGAACARDDRRCQQQRFSPKRLHGRGSLPAARLEPFRF